MAAWGFHTIHQQQVWMMHDVGNSCDDLIWPMMRTSLGRFSDPFAVPALELLPFARLESCCSIFLGCLRPTQCHLNLLGCECTCVC